MNPNQAFQNNPNLPGLVIHQQTAGEQPAVFPVGLDQQRPAVLLHPVSDHQNQWLDYNTGQQEDHGSHQNEFSLFFKDDWKVSPSFTANLGIRYEYYGVPWEGQGLTAVPVGGGLTRCLEFPAEASTPG